MKSLLARTPVLALLMLAGCVSIPGGPSMMALPGTGKSFDQFRADDAECRQFASAQIGGASPNQVVTESGVKSAAVGTAIGAVAGAAIGGERGAGVGAGTGLLVGGLAGTSAGESSGYALQRRYDYAYIQCMYAKGDRVPVSGQFHEAPQAPSRYTPPPPRNQPPPPPAGTPPPPPPQ
jgi:phage tail tape-measure protein